MELSYHELTSQGPVRLKNEDALGFSQPDNPDEWHARGAVSIICDGVGGHGNGDKASRLAVQTALRAYEAAAAGTAPTPLLRQMFNAANIAVYDAGMERQDINRMATTMTVCLFRHHEAFIGHVGDCRVYHIHGAEISCITNDHSYTGMQMKLGLLNAQEAANSDLRCVLTRSIGKDPMVQVDFYRIQVNPGDYIVQCCDGVYVCVSEHEIYEAVTRSPDSACQEILSLCERRGGDDNQSVQVIQVRQVERVTYFRGLPIYQPVQDPTMGQGLEIDHILDGRYQIIDQISRSGMATIYRAIDTKTGAAVALKVPHFEFESDPGFYSRFQREEEIGQRMRHPYILRIEAPEGLEKSRPYIVMEYLQGQTLGRLMKSVVPLPESDALKIASRVCDALQYMHENGVIHRDLKPDNIMICDDGSIRIMDFGIAKVEGAKRLTFGKFQPAMGTPDYMSPEQVKGARGDVTSDIYSMGAILYEMVTGFPPFEGANPLVIMNSRLTGDPVGPRKRNGNLSPHTEEIILHAMERKPKDRYPSAAELRHDLDYPYEVAITGRAERLQPVKPMQSRLRRHMAVVVAIGIVVIVAAIFLIATRLKIHVEVR